VPPWAYELLARLLAEAAESDTTGSVRSTLHGVAQDVGRQISTKSGGDLVTALRGGGYQPQTGPDGGIELRNCPFHRLAQEHRDLVCGLNLRLVEGMITGSTQPGARAGLTPSPDRCCVVVRGG
jgi:predicted ArsR family transcriptional regulator